MVCRRVWRNFHWNLRKMDCRVALSEEVSMTGLEVKTYLVLNKVFRGRQSAEVDEVPKDFDKVPKSCKAKCLIILKD